MDDMDKYLSRLPHHPYPQELSERICRAIRERRKRQCRIRRIISGVLALNGIWLIVPLVTEYIRRISLPASGAQWLLNLGKLVLADTQSWFILGVENLLTYHLDVPVAAKTTSVIGLAFLSVSALLALEQILPRQDL